MVEELEVVKHVAVAVQEVAKTTGKGIDAGVKIGGFVSSIFGHALKETVGLYWTDKITAKRIEASIYNWERFELLMSRTKERLNKKGVVNIRTIPPKIALPLIESATIEHEEDLHSLWANLLATGMDANEKQIERKYVTMLGEMTANDADVLRSMFVDAKKEISKKETKAGDVTYGPSIPGTDRYDDISVITLNRLGLIEASHITFSNFVPGGSDHNYGDYGPSRHSVTVPNDLIAVNLTVLGYAFGRAVGLDSSEKFDEQIN